LDAERQRAEQHFREVCALVENAKCAHYFTPELDGLAQIWRGVCGWVPSAEYRAEHSEHNPKVERESSEDEEDDTVAVKDDATISMSKPDGTMTEPIPLRQFEKAVDRITREAAEKRGADPATGEIKQPTLDDSMFPAVERRSVPMVKLSVTGTVEMPQCEFQAYCDRGLHPGSVVTLTLSGYLPDPHVRWTKRSEGKRTWWELEAAVRVKAIELGAFELTGEVFDET
jgi:hypothetical protein